MRYWRYQHRPLVAGHDILVINDALIDGTESRLLVDGAEQARVLVTLASPDPMAIQQLAATLPDGRRLQVETGYNSWWGTGANAFVDDRLVWESHPGKPLEPPAAVKAMFAGKRGQAHQANAEQLKRNWPVMACDIGLALLFFVVAKFTDLPTAAITSAVAGLLLAVVQRFVKVDLLGGLASFGIVMSLLSAGFAILFQDDRAVMMRSTILGVISALAFLSDAALGGRWLGKGLARYVPGGAEPRRLALGMGVLGLVMAGGEQAVIELGGKDPWLTYTTFLETPVAIVLVLLMLRWARG